MLSQFILHVIYKPIAQIERNAKRDRRLLIFGTRFIR
jgi:hypothetical protein